MEKQTRTLVIATKNEGKLREFKAVLEPLGFSAVPVGDIDAAIAEPEETGMTFAENAALKATYYMDKTGYSCLADDSGLIVDVLHGRPGVYSARSTTTPTITRNSSRSFPAYRQKSVRPVMPAFLFWQGPAGNY